MAITTLAGIKSGLIQPIHVSKVGTSPSAGPMRSHWALGGYPAAGSYNATLNGVALSAPVTGAIPFTNPASGSTYVAGFSTTSFASSGFLMLCDRLWHNGGFTITSTSAQAITSPTWPARDNNGSTNGEGVFLALEVSATVGAATPTITVGYTNSDGTAGRTATNIEAAVSGQTATAFYRIGLQAGDKGVRSVQSLTLSASWVSGTINLVAYRPIAFFSPGPGSSGGTNNDDPLSSGFPVMYNDSVPFFVGMTQVSGTGAICGSLLLAQG